LLHQRLRAVSWPHGRLRSIQRLLGHGMGVVRPWPLSRGDPSALSVNCQARFICSAPAFLVLCLTPPAVDLIEALCWSVCVKLCTILRDGLAAFVCVCRRTSADSVELLPRGWRAVAFPQWLQRSKLLDVAHCSLLLLRLVIWLHWRYLCIRRAASSG